MAGELSSPASVQVRRSARRRRTVAAYRDGETVVILIPARFSAAEEREWVERMLARLDSRERRSRRRGDAELEARAGQLIRQYFDGRLRPVSVRWVANQRGRWGSCTPADGTIRLSDRLRPMPSWVIDYVLVHELAHLRVPGHGPDFWALVERYPRAQRARGYLEGVAAAAGIAFSSDGELGGLTGGEVGGEVGEINDVDEVGEIREVESAAADSDLGAAGRAG
jgi:predicted metal-dependent hydrolase